MLITGIIPARYASSRFPGKPLAEIGGKPMIQLVYEKVKPALESVYVATDDERIANVVHGFKGRVIMTSADHRSGTERCAEAVSYIRSEQGFNPDVIINIQGDEPFIKPGQINQLCSCFDDNSVEIATLVKKITDLDDLKNPNKPKVVRDLNEYALYFSRSAIPFTESSVSNCKGNETAYFKHIGIYGYRTDTLLKISMLTPSPLEIAESLEQNRWLENGFKIKTVVTQWESIGIDTPDDLEYAKLLLM
ncbi:MAG TPA: 3-deoxy-manno-octulosonate cytidylyltransferase [Bacteroidales bacterium]|nr:3-deoxy-manno-octulosonate cytidylyltransferase [Bacteroidales bacterium]